MDVGQGGAEGFKHVVAGGVMVCQQVGDDFSVGLGGELKAEVLQVFAQRRVVFDDAVVHYRQAVGNVRVGVALGRFAVGGPAGVGDAQGAADRRGLQGAFQFGNLADRAYALDAVTGVQYSNAGGVVTAVFETAQAFKQNGGDIALGGGADDSAHGGVLGWQTKAGVYHRWLGSVDVSFARPPEAIFSARQGGGSVV